MSKLLDAVRNATTVMDGAATFIGSQKARLAAVKAELDAQGVQSAELDAAIVALDTEAAELTSAMAEGTAAAPAENPTPDTAPVVDPATAPTA